MLRSDGKENWKINNTGHFVFILFPGLESWATPVAKNSGLTPGSTEIIWERGD